MNIPAVEIPIDGALELEQFREMDYFAVEHYNLPIELMMENAGLQLARLVAIQASRESKILIGIGNGNNGGGGLVAARRLSAWGYAVHLDLITEIRKDLPRAQLDRALRFGANPHQIEEPDIWVDAYMGFSQRLPLKSDLIERINRASSSSALRISLDLPTGYIGDLNTPRFTANQILTLAAPKKILYSLPNTELFLADLGLPAKVYAEFGSTPPPFEQGGILQILN